MKVCFVGLGSIGKRHLLNLHDICSKEQIDLEVHALRTGNMQLTEDIRRLVHKQFTSKQQLDREYDAIFLTNPTNLHYESLTELKGYSKAFFIEKPVFDNIFYDLNSLKLPEDGIYYVACPLRYTSVLMYLKQYVKKTKIYCARAISSSYLPDWRPGVDYKKIYSASKEQGGGVRIDLIHEWDYLTDMFGSPSEINLLYGTFSHLDITSEDLAVYTAKYPDKIVELHLDYFGRVPRRFIELFTKEQIVIGDIIKSEITFSDGSEAIRFHEKPNDKYTREMRYFLELMHKKVENTNTIENSINTMKIALGEV